MVIVAVAGCDFEGLVSFRVLWFGVLLVMMCDDFYLVVCHFAWRSVCEFAWMLLEVSVFIVIELYVGCVVVVDCIVCVLGEVIELLSSVEFEVLRVSVVDVVIEIGE